MSNKVHFHKPVSPDDLLGRVGNDGRVYETRFGPDHYVGRVDLAEGKIYEARPGFDHYLGRVELASGKIFLARVGPDEYLGRVEEGGKLFVQRRLAPDLYVGKVSEMTSFAHGGAAFLLLVKPVLDAEADEKNPEVEKARKQAGAAPSEKPNGGGDRPTRD